MSPKILLIAGPVSSALYAAMLIGIPRLDSGYDSATQAVSELSAIGSPTRAVWVAFGLAYTMLLAGFGWGLRQGAGANRGLRFAPGCLILQGISGLYWPPMHPRGADFALTDALHIVWAIAAVLFMLGAIFAGSLAFGRTFRNFSWVTLTVQLVGGTMTGLLSPNLAANRPTPWLGVWERLNIAAFLVWVVVLAIAAWPPYVQSPRPTPRSIRAHPV